MSISEYQKFLSNYFLKKKREISVQEDESLKVLRTLRQKKISDGTDLLSKLCAMDAFGNCDFSLNVSAQLWDTGIWRDHDDIAQTYTKTTDDFPIAFAYMKAHTFMTTLSEMDDGVFHDSLWLPFATVSCASDAQIELLDQLRSVMEKKKQLSEDVGWPEDRILDSPAFDIIFKIVELDPEVRQWYKESKKQKK